VRDDSRTASCCDAVIVNVRGVRTLGWLLKSELAVRGRMARMFREWWCRSCASLNPAYVLICLVIRNFLLSAFLPGRHDAVFCADVFFKLRRIRRGKS